MNTCYASAHKSGRAIAEPDSCARSAAGRVSSPSVSITEAPVRGGVGNPPGLTVSVDPGHRAVWVSPDPGPTPGQPEAW
mgnify:CR=1 FL=1